jgi:hypothetical protein
MPSREFAAWAAGLRSLKRLYKNGRVVKVCLALRVCLLGDPWVRRRGASVLKKIGKASSSSSICSHTVLLP